MHHLLNPQNSEEFSQSTSLMDAKSRTPASFWGATLILFTWVVMLGISRLLVFESMHSNWDFAILVDGSWRVLQGQHPHDDFSTPLGAFTFIPGAFGMLVSGSQSLAGINLGIVLVGTLFTFATFIVLAWRNGTISGLLFGLVSSSYFFTPRTMNHGGDYLSYTGFYNAWAWAIFGFLFVLLMTPFLRNDSNKSSLLTGICTGIGFSTLVFLKFTFAIPAVFAILVFIFSMERGKRLQFTMSSLVSAIATSLVGIYLAGGRVFPILRDALIPLIARQSDPLDYGSTLHELVDESILPALLLFLCSLLLVLLRQTSLGRTIAVLVLALSAQIIITITITQPAELVMNSFVSLVLFPFVFDRKLNPLVGSEFSVWQLFGRTIVAAVLLLQILTSVLLNVEPISRLVTTDKSRIPTFAENAWILPPSDRAEEAEYRATLKQFLTPDSKLITVGFNNMYSWLYQLSSPRGAPLYWHKGVSFSKTVFDMSLLRCDDTLNDANIISLDGYLGNQPYVDEFLASCEQELVRDFETIYQSDRHQILVRVR